jgi:hypothetical protein
VPNEFDSHCVGAALGPSSERCVIAVRRRKACLVVWPAWADICDTAIREPGPGNNHPFTLTKRKGRTRALLAELVARGGDEDACAAGFAPHALI